jgi:Tol biopolymer transport system component
MWAMARTAALVALPLCQTTAPAPVHTLRQDDPTSKPLDAPSASISADGRFVAFASYARLAPADTNACRDIYVLDRLDGRVTLESLTPAGQVSDGDSAHPRLDADGRLLVFETMFGDPPQMEVILRDRIAGTTRVISRPVRGDRADGGSYRPEISRDGRVVVFESTATSLVTVADANGGGEDVYLVELASGATSRLSVNDKGVQSASGISKHASVSDDGNLVAFASNAGLDRATAGTRGQGGAARKPFDVYVRDRRRNMTQRVSVRPRGRVADGGSWAPAISGNGRYVAFVSEATNMIDGDRNRSTDVFLSDLQTASIELVSRRAGGGPANGSSASPALSSDGRYVAFQSEASDLLCTRRCQPGSDDINLLWDVFLLDRRTASMARVSGDGAIGWMEPSAGPSLDSTGTVVIFSSRHPVDATDTNNDFDLFVWSSPLRLPLSSPGP